MNLVNVNKIYLFKALVFTFNNFILKSINGINFYSYAEHLNMFNEMSSEELENAVLKAQEQTKTTLEEEIETLHLQKDLLKEKVQTYLEIEKKKEEIKMLIEKLES
jgi:hypothetical protein